MTNLCGVQTVEVRTLGCNKKFRPDPEDPNDVKFPSVNL